MKLSEEKCEAGCKAYTGDEIKHHKDCVFYKESFSKMYDDIKQQNNELLEALIVTIIVMKNGGLKNEKLNKQCLKDFIELIEKIKGQKWSDIIKG